MLDNKFCKEELIFVDGICSFIKFLFYKPFSLEKKENVDLMLRLIKD